MFTAVIYTAATLTYFCHRIFLGVTRSGECEVEERMEGGKRRERRQEMEESSEKKRRKDGRVGKML